MSRRVVVAAVLTLLAGIGRPVHAQAGAVEREDIEGREEWFWAERSYPFAERPYDRMYRMMLSTQGLARTYAALSGMPVLGGSWRSIGPTGFWDPGGGFFGTVGGLDAGRISAIVPPVTAGGPMFIGTASGGVWKSTNSGASWTPLTDGECALTVGALWVDDRAPSTVYAGTGEFNSGLTGCGMLRSSDGGSTWTRVGGFTSSAGGGGTWGKIVADASSPSTLVATTNFGNAGVVRSTNGGSSWTITLNIGPGTSLVPHPTRAGTYYAAVGNTTNTARGVYRSTDAGATWTLLPDLPGILTDSIGRIELAVSAAQPTVVWALVGNRYNGKLYGLLRYSETTNSWTSLAASGIVTASTNRGDFGTQQSYDLVLAVDPRDAQKVFVAGVRAYRSTDGGATFKPVAMEIHCDWHVLVFDRFNPDIMWAGTDGGVYVSYDAGLTWSARNAGLAIAQFYPGIAVHPQTSRVLGGLQDNGTMMYSGSMFWDGYAATGDGGYNAINYRDPTISYYESYWNNGPAVVRRSAVGSSSRNTGIVTTDRSQFFPPLILDPVTPTKLYFGTMRLYRTVNEGQLWTPITQDLTSGTGTIRAIAVSPADSNTIWVGTSDGRALVSRDAGVTFVLATGLPNRTVTRVVPHPTDPLRALITVSGFGTGHVFETRDAFATAVTNVSGNLPDAPTNVALYIPEQDLILAGTDVGVFQSANGGTAWSLGPGGLPNVIVQDLVYQSTTGLLVAATYGRGVFAYNVGTQTAVLRGDANGDGKVDAADALLIQQALVAASPATTAVFPRGDANCNGTLDAADVVVVLRAAVGLPTGSACVGTVR